MIDRAEVLSVTEDSVLLGFALRRSADVRLQLRCATDGRGMEQTGFARVGRLCAAGLEPDTLYEVVLGVEGATRHLGTVRTLPAPEGTPRHTFAVFGDPHVSLDRQTCKGRLFTESSVLLRDVLQDVGREACEFVLIAGDLTDQGTPEQYAQVRDILAEAPCPVYAVPGDHDIYRGETGFEEACGPTSWVRDVDGMRIVGCNTAHKELGEAGEAHLRATVGQGTSAAMLTVLLSHLQLVEDDYIVDEDRVVRDHAQFADEVLPQLRGTTLAYAGHKNVPSQLRRESFIQVNVPQPVQYPCGWLKVRVFDSGVYHTFQPIFSEVLNEGSRVGGEARELEKWTTAYRQGRGWEAWNCVVGGACGPMIW